MKFLSTNILVYAAIRKKEDFERQRIVRALLEADSLAISLEVLQEFYHVAWNPKKLALNHDEAVVFCNGWRRFTVLALFNDALVLCHRYQIQFYNAAIPGAARKLKCRILQSEDLSHGQTCGGVRVVNPFSWI